MSSSAFTPSTTTVTNNVPTNVPVVTAWEAYTPDIFEGSNLKNLDFSSRNGRHRRVGDSVEIEMVLLGNSNARSGTGQFCVSIPSGLTIDTTKLSDASRSLTGNISVGTGSPLDGVVSISRTNNLIGAIDKGTGPIAYNNTTLNPSNAEMSIYATIPIAEWSGSGTTTLATRAVEEYAFNTNTGASNDTSSFGYGPDGVLFPNITTYGTIFAKRVRFQTSILSTDSIIVEYQQAGTGVWRSTAQRMPYVTMGNSAYGIQILNVSSTDVEIQFNSQGAVSNGLTYASNGELWSAYHGAGWKWRVRKVSSGAQVGYPVSARNIVGDTSGSVVPVGMLGERVTSGVLSSTTVINTTNTDLTSISIGAGVWLVSTRATLSYTSGTGLNDRGNVACWITDGTTVYGQVTPAYAKTMVSGNQNASIGNASFSVIVNTSTPKTLTFRAVRSDIQNTSAATAQTESANNGLELFAIRIA